MKKKINQLKYVFLFCIIVSFMVQFVYILSSQLTLSLLQKILLIIIQFLSISGYAHFYLLNQSEEKRRKGIRRVHWLLFIIYCLNLLYVLFLDPDFGRKVIKETLSLEEYFQYNVNLNPFESIMLFVDGYHNGVVTLESLCVNLLGNFVVFMPTAYFLPLLFKRQKKWYWYVLTILLIVFGVEVLQTLLRIGSGDIDDLLLNVTGAMFMYLFFKCLPLQHLFDWLGKD